MRYHRKIIQIKATDSPNVKLGLMQEAAGVTPTNEEIVPGLLSYADYKSHRALWDPIMQCIKLDAEFYEGKEIKMFPAEWLDRCQENAEALESKGIRRTEAIGVDPAEGGDRSAWAETDKYGLIDIHSRSTPDTNMVVLFTIDLMKSRNVAPDKVCFDRGGGGKEHADRMRMMGYDVQMVSFGESVSRIEPKRSMTMFAERIQSHELTYTYASRRAQMYHQIRLLMDPASEIDYCLPERVLNWREPARKSLREQLQIIPLQYDEKDRIFLPKKDEFIDILGHSPDEADAFVVAEYIRLKKPVKRKVRVMG